MHTVKHALAEVAKNFSLQIFQHPDLRTITAEALDRSGRREQRRCPLSAELVFTFVLLMGLHRAESLRTLLTRLLEMLRERDPDLRLNAVSPEAVCHARARLGPEAHRIAFELTTEKVRPPCWIGGYRVYALDGTKADLADTTRNEAEFGRPGASRGRAAFPQALLLALVDVRTHRLKGASIHPCWMPERDASLPLLDRLGKRDLLLLDRGYDAAWYYYELEHRQIPFLARCKAGRKIRRLHQLKDGSWLVEVRGERPGSRHLKDTWKGPRSFRLTLRMIEYKVGDSPEIRLLTNVLDIDACPALAMAELYAYRWEGELVFDQLKNHFATVTHGTLRTLFRSKRPAGVRQEAWALFLTYNLVRETMHQAACSQKEDPRMISFVATVEIIRRALPRIERAPRRHQRLLFSQLLDDIADQKISRPRRSEANPRKVKRKMSNFGVKLAHHKTEPRCRRPQILTELEPLCS